MADYIIRATAADGQIRAFASTTRDLVEEARKAHNTSPVATVALGRLLTAGGMMGSMMKGEDDLLTITGENGFEMRLDVSGTLNGAQTGTTVQDLKINATGIGAMRLQIGANEHQVLEVNIPAVSLQNMGIENVDVSTAEGADDAIDRVDGAIKYVSSVRGRLGAFQNRLESTINSLDITSENMTSAYSRIMDVDMAEEMTSYTTYQILAQAGTSMLAQANERPSQVLQLLQ